VKINAAKALCRAWLEQLWSRAMHMRLLPGYIFL